MPRCWRGTASYAGDPSARLGDSLAMRPWFFFVSLSDQRGKTAGEPVRERVRIDGEPSDKVAAVIVDPQRMPLRFAVRQVHDHAHAPADLAQRPSVARFEMRRRHCLRPVQCEQDAPPARSNVLLMLIPIEEALEDQTPPPSIPAFVARKLPDATADERANVCAFIAMNLTLGAIGDDPPAPVPSEEWERIASMRAALPAGAGDAT